MILDTNGLSAWAEGEPDVLDILPAAHAIALPVIVVGEYLWGVRRSRLRPSLESWLQSVVRSVQILPVTLSTAASYATVREMAKSKRRPIPANDAWIAALALEHSLPVLSRDAHFDVVDGIRRVAW